MKEVTFIHAADLHLDSPFKGLTHLPAALFEEVRESPFYAFDKLIQQAKQHHIDFLLLAGDLFDHDIQSLKAQIHLRDAFLKLKEYNIQVFLSYGNHDFIYEDRQQVAFPENVHIFQSEEVSSFIYDKDEQPLAEIHGFSYEKRAITEEKVNDYPVRDPQIPFHIGMLHGSIHGDTVHHAYAPFQLHQLEEKMYDYWALGHIHKRKVLNEDPPIIYPGNIQGRHRKETDEKGCYFVKMTEGEIDTSFIPLQHIKFVDLEISLTDIEAIEDAENALEKRLADLNGSPILIHLKWIKAEPNQFGEQTERLLNELSEVLNDSVSENVPWKYIYKTNIEFAEIEKEKVNALFLEEAENAFLELDVHKEISELLEHPKARRFLELPSNEELLKKSKDTLLRKLLQRSGD